MRMLLSRHRNNLRGMIIILFCAAMVLLSVNAKAADGSRRLSVDRAEVVAQQIKLLKNRYRQLEQELSGLTKSQSLMPASQLDQASKNLLDKASLDISVAKSNLESISIELSDARSAADLLAKSMREVNNQLNALSIFGSHIANHDDFNADGLRAEIEYQRRLASLEAERIKYLRKLQEDAASILQIKKDYQTKFNAQVKSQRLLRIKQREVREELAYQEEQNLWLERLNVLYDKISKTNPVSAKSQFLDLEAQIFAANEHANFAYTQSLIARYGDQIHQLKSAALKSSSIAQLNELSSEEQQLNSQLERLQGLISSHINNLDDHIAAMVQKKITETDATYPDNMKALQVRYRASFEELKQLSANLALFHVQLDKALQIELSARQGLPSFDGRSMLEIGKEMLLVPALTFQVLKNLVVNTVLSIKSASTAAWTLYLSAQAALIVLAFFTGRAASYLLLIPSSWRERINSRWLSLKWLEHHFIDLYLLLNFVLTMMIFSVPFNNYIFFVYLAGVWFLFRSLIVIARICLVETMNHPAGKDMRLYQRLRWMFSAGGAFTAAAVFIYQLPFIYELKNLANRFLLLFMLMVSLILLRFWDVVPALILSHMEKKHPYFEKIVRLFGLLIPLLLLGNSTIGLLGYVNLVMTITWYEGIFLLVLIGYLLLRGLLSDGVEQISRVVIQHSNNGWLLSEAFLKPLDRILRIFLMLSAGAALFLLYGWDHQSPIVERLNGLLHYQMIHVLDTAITPVRIMGLFVVISVFYWTARWTREFVFRSLTSRTEDMGIRNSMAILSQYAVIVIGVLICLKVLGIDSRAVAAATAMLAFGVGLGLRDMANNFFSGFLILLERPLRVGDIIAVNNIEGEVINIGSRAVTVMTWDHTALVVPNAEIFNKSFTNLTARDNVVRCIAKIKTSRHDNPMHVRTIIEQVLKDNKMILTDPEPEVFLKEMNDLLLSFELRYYVNIRQVKSRTLVASALLMAIWDAFARCGIKPPYPQQEIFLRNEEMTAGMMSGNDEKETWHTANQ